MGLQISPRDRRKPFLRFGSKAVPARGPLRLKHQKQPLGPVHEGGGLVDPKGAFKSLFVGGKVPVRGSIGVSVEEGLLRSIAADAAGDTDSAL